MREKAVSFYRWSKDVTEKGVSFYRRSKDVREKGVSFYRWSKDVAIWMGVVNFVGKGGG